MTVQQAMRVNDSNSPPRQRLLAIADLEDTRTLGQALAGILPARSVVALNGQLGAGKTHLVQELAAAAGVDRSGVTSPTFVLIHEYRGRLPIYHLDAYRIADDDEFLELGPDEYFERDGWTLIEWANRVQRCLPREYLQIELVITGETTRQAVVTAVGAKYEKLLEELDQALPKRLKARPT